MSSPEVKAEKQPNVLQRGVSAVIDLLSSFFLPIINLLVSVGILKGILTLLQVCGVVETGTSTYAILNGMADSLFYFIPLFLAYTSSKRFGVDTVTGMLLGCIILYPDITAAMAGDDAVYLFGLELTKVTYSSSVIPILLAMYCASWVQKACYRIIPETFRGMFTPPITIIIVIPLTLGIFGPLGSLVGGWLATGYEFIYGLSPLVAGILIGAFQPFLVILGLHWALFTIAMNNVAVYGFDTIMARFGGAIFAQGGAALAVALKTKNNKFRSQAIAASLTTLLGITEPAMYGVNLRLKKPMVCACVAGGIGSAVAGFFGCAGTAFALPALTTLPVFMSRAFIPFCLSLAIAFGLAFLFTLIVPVRDLTEEEMELEEQA